MKLCSKVISICLAIVLILCPLTAMADDVDGDTEVANISEEYEEESEYESNDVQVNGLTYEKEQVPEPVSDDTQQDTDDNLQGENTTESANLSSIDTDALVEWVNDNPDKLSALYNGDATTIASLAEFLAVS